jgi:hypothetical protein
MTIMRSMPALGHGPPPSPSIADAVVCVVKVFDMRNATFRTVTTGMMMFDHSVTKAETTPAPGRRGGWRR